MKKLLGILLTAVMVCTSMGVLATNNTTENDIIFNADFEPNKEGEAVTGSGEGFITTEGTIVDKTTESIAVAAGQEGPSGEKCVKLAKGKRLMINKTDILSPNTMYKLAFWYYNTNAFTDANRKTWPGGNAWIVPNVLGLGITSGANAAKMPGRASNDPVWIHYEIYFMTSNTSLIFQFTGTGGAGSAVEYFDDVTVTKASDSAQISFVKATDYTMAALNTSYFSPTTKALQLTGAIENKPTWVYSRVVKNMPVDSFKEATRVMAQYTPKSINEKTTLVAAVYGKVGENPVLKKVYLKECTFEAKPDNATTIDHYVLEPTITYLDIPAEAYASGNFVRAFMINNLSDIKSISEVATLPAAQ